jgi:sialic acid synthase SpsE
MLKIVRPGYGPSPSKIANIVGLVAKRKIQLGERISEDDFE